MALKQVSLCLFIQYIYLCQALANFSFRSFPARTVKACMAHLKKEIFKDVGKFNATLVNIEACKPTGGFSQQQIHNMIQWLGLHRLLRQRWQPALPKMSRTRRRITSMPRCGGGGRPLHCQCLVGGGPPRGELFGGGPLYQQCCSGNVEENSRINASGYKDATFFSCSRSRERPYRTVRYST